MAQLKNLLVSGTSRTIGKGYFGGLVSSGPSELVHNSNEFNFIPVGYSGDIYINYKDSARTNGNISRYRFCKGTGDAGTAIVKAGTFEGALTGDVTGNLTGNVQLNRTGGTANGRISFYSSSYYTWFEYMSNPATSGCPTGGTPSTYGDVTSWARRSLIENSAGYGWIWEGASNAAASGATAPTPLMALSSNTGNLKVKGYISTEVGFANASSQVILKPGTGKYAVVLNNSVGDVDDGNANVASGAWSLATGTGTQATGWASFSGGSGYRTIASGSSSFAFGTGYNFLGTAASASGAVTFGGNSSGQYSFSVSGTAAHNHSFALGEGTKTYCANGFAVGKYNADNGALFAVGYGTSDSARTNVFDVSSTGDVMATGVIYAYNALGSDTGDLYLNNSSVNYNTTDECIEFKFY